MVGAVGGDRLGAGAKLSWLVAEVPLFAREDSGT